MNRSVHYRRPRAALLLVSMTALAAATPSVRQQNPPNQLVPLLLLGLFVLAALSIVAVTFLHQAARRRARAVAAPPGGGDAVGVPLAPLAGNLDAPPPAWLELAADATRRFAVVELPFTIGRAAGSELVIDETFPDWQTVSREHAIITRHPRGYVIADRGSCNGLRVNGRLTPKNLLRDGCQVALGGVNFRFVDRTKPS